MTDLAALSGATACLSSAGLAVGGTSTKFKTAAPNGAGIDYCIKGTAYHKADGDNISLTAATAQAVSTSCLYLVQIDADGNFTTKKGVEQLTANLGVSASLQFPEPDDSKCPVGYIRVDTDASTTFTAGTTDLAASGITDSYINCALGIPNVPLVS